jgi:hypothetical protein
MTKSLSFHWKEETILLLKKTIIDSISSNESERNLCTTEKSAFSWKTSFLAAAQKTKESCVNGPFWNSHLLESSDRFD